MAEKFAIANKTKCLTRNNNSKAQFEENDLEEDKENLKQSLPTTKLNPPQFDRSIKPKHSSPVDTEVRVRNFSPVSGKVVSNDEFKSKSIKTCDGPSRHLSVTKKKNQ